MGVGCPHSVFAQGLQGQCSHGGIQLTPLLISRGLLIPWARQGFAPAQPAGKQGWGQEWCQCSPGTALAALPGSRRWMELMPQCPCTNAPDPNPARNQSCKHIPNCTSLACSSVYSHTVSLLLLNNNIHLSWGKGQRCHHLTLWEGKKIFLCSMLPLSFLRHPPSC